MSPPLKIYRNGLDWATPSTGLAIASTGDEAFEDVSLDATDQQPDPSQPQTNANRFSDHMDPPPQRPPRNAKVKQPVLESPSERFKGRTLVDQHPRPSRRLSLLPDVSHVPPEDSLELVNPSSRLFRSKSAKGKFDDLFFTKGHVSEKLVVEPAIQPYYNREYDVIAFAEEPRTYPTILDDLRYPHLTAPGHTLSAVTAGSKHASEQLRPLQTGNVVTWGISGKTAEHRPPGLLNLPLAVRDRIWSHFFPSSKALRTILLTPTCTGNQVFPKDHFEHFLSVMTADVRAAMLACRTLRNELTVYFWSTFKFHMTITGFSCALINPAIKELIPLYSHHIQNLTIEVDLTKLGFSPRRNALYLGKALDRIGRNLRVVISALVQRPAEMSELHLMCRRYKGRRPTWNSQIDVGGCGRRTLYCCDAPLAMFDCVRAFRGRLGKIRMSGFSKKYTDDMIFHLFVKSKLAPTCIMPSNPAWPNYYLVAPGETLPFIHSVSGTTSGEEVPPTIATPFECAEELALATGALDIDTSGRFRDAILHARSEVLVPSRASLYVDDIEETMCTADPYQDRTVKQFGVIMRTRRHHEQENTPRQEAINFRDDDEIPQNDEQDQHFGTLAGLDADERDQFLNSLSSRQLEHLYRFIDYRKMPGGGALFSKLESCLVTESSNKFKRAEIIMYHAGYESEKARRSRKRRHKRFRYQPQPLIVPVLVAFMRRQAASSEASGNGKEVRRKQGRRPFLRLPIRTVVPSTQTIDQPRAASNKTDSTSTFLATPRSVHDPQCKRRRSLAQYFGWFRLRRPSATQHGSSNIELTALNTPHAVADLSPFDKGKTSAHDAVPGKHTSTTTSSAAPRSIGNALSKQTSTCTRRLSWFKAYHHLSSEDEDSPFDRNLARSGTVGENIISPPPVAMLNEKPVAYEYHTWSSYPQTAIKSPPAVTPGRQPHHTWSPCPQSGTRAPSSVTPAPFNTSSPSPVADLDRQPFHMSSPYPRAARREPSNVTHRPINISSSSPTTVSDREPYHPWSPYPPSSKSEASDRAQRSVIHFV